MSGSSVDNVMKSGVGAPARRVPWNRTFSEELDEWLESVTTWRWVKWTQHSPNSSQGYQKQMSCRTTGLQRCAITLTNRFCFCRFDSRIWFVRDTWQFIIFTVFTITACIFSYSLSILFWTQGLASQQILSSIDRFLSYRTDSTDCRTI